MFKSKINKKNIIDKIEKDGFLDFVSKIDKNKFYLVLNNLIKFKCLSFRYEGSYEINKFGKWVLRLQLDLMSLFIIYKIIGNCENVCYEFIESIAIINFGNSLSYELFYSNINPEWFKLAFVDYHDDFNDFGDENNNNENQSENQSENNQNESENNNENENNESENNQNESENNENQSENYQNESENNENENE